MAPAAGGLPLCSSTLTPRATLRLWEPDKKNVGVGLGAASPSPCARPAPPTHSFLGNILTSPHHTSSLAPSLTPLCLAADGQWVLLQGGGGGGGGGEGGIFPETTFSEAVDLRQAWFLRLGGGWIFEELGCVARGATANDKRSEAHPTMQIYLRF